MPRNNDDPFYGIDALDALDGEYDLLSGDDPMLGAELSMGLSKPAIKQELLNRLAVGRAVQAQAQARTRQRSALLSTVKDQPGNFIGIDSAQVVGLVTGLILAGTAAQIPVVADRDCRPIAIVADPTNAALFTISGFQVSGHQVFFSNVGVPAFRFTPQAPRTPIRSPILKAAVPAFLTVNNISAGAARFLGNVDVIGIDEP